MTALPIFVSGHVLVAFHDENDFAGIQEAIDLQTPAERALQEELSLHFGSDYPSADTVVLDDLSRADGITSHDLRASNGQGEEEDVHRLIVDIDMPVVAIPSSTEGHFHLYIDHLMPWTDYLRLLEVMTDVGLIEEGYLAATRDQGYSSVRLPWVKKDAAAALDDELDELISTLEPTA